jgi:hypothetical protein
MLPERNYAVKRNDKNRPEYQNFTEDTVGVEEFGKHIMLDKHGSL